MGLEEYEMRTKKTSFFSLIMIISLLFSIFLYPITQSFAQEVTKVMIHYQEDLNNNLDWNLWVWEDGKEGSVYEFSGEDQFGKFAEIELPGSPALVGFIVRTDDWIKDGGDRFIDIENGLGEAWVIAGDETTYFEIPDNGAPIETPQFEEIKLTIHYYRYDQNYNGWNLWIWPFEKEGHGVEFSEEDEYGKVAYDTLSNVNDLKKVGIIIRRSEEGNEWAEKEFGDRFITKINNDGTAEIWLIQGQERIYYDKNQIDLTPKIVQASIDAFNFFTLETNTPFSLDKENFGITISPNIKLKVIVPFETIGENYTNKVRIITDEPIDISKTYTISLEGFGEQVFELGDIVRSKEFDELYYYNGDDLGNSYSQEKTSFRLWAPTATEVRIVTYQNSQDTVGKEFPMTKAEKGTWTAEMAGDQHGLIYNYKVKIDEEWREAVDPYVRAVTVNGDKGVVVDLQQTNPENWQPNKKPDFRNPEDAIIYELHVRDLSTHPDSGIENKGKFLGVAEENTTSPTGVKTGLNHLIDLGVTHVQFLPIYDYRTVDETKLDQEQFNWGYDPKNYNVPEGSYSTDPYEPIVRINEVKQMIQTLHDNDLRIIMDVVYNHVFSVNESSFQQLVPGYYFRYTSSGTLANGSGVGNDTASERKMVRKFIVDSVKYWAREYNLDGFRFDLMGIHDIETMNEIRAALDEIDPSIIIIGEGWDLNTPLKADLKANQKNAEDMEGIAHFNDNIRDGLKGSVFNDLDNGFVNGKQAMVGTIFQGVLAGLNYPGQIATYRDPEQVVTYVEAHDNLTLWDKLILTNPEDSVEQLKQRHKLASSIVLTAQGIPFIHAGQEFMRSKAGDHNSYKSSDEVNQLDWEQRAEFSSEVDYIKGLIQLRKTYSAFRMTTAEEILNNLTLISAPKNVLAYRLQPIGQQQEEIIVVHNANEEAVEIELASEGKWNLVVDGFQAGIEPIKQISGKSFSVAPLSTYVLIEEKSNLLPYIIAAITILTVLIMVATAFLRRRQK